MPHRTLILTVVVFALTIAVVPASAQSMAATGPQTAPVPGMMTQPPAPPPPVATTPPHTWAVPVAGAATGGGTFSGTLMLSSFSVQNGQVVVSGTLAGLVTGGSAGSTSLVANLALPVTMAQSGCQAVNATLGPGAVALAGGTVNIGPVALNLTAQPGSGSGDQLGSLMCGAPAVGGDPNSLATLLNQILAAL